MIEQNNYKEWSGFHKKLGVGLILLFVTLVFGFEFYRTYISSTSEIRYTIINFYAPYSEGKGRGMKIHYLAEGKQEHGNCLSNRCRKILTGERRLGFFYLKDPSMYDILFDVVVPDSVIAPAGGWKEIPHWQQVCHEIFDMNQRHIVQKIVVNLPQSPSKKRLQTTSWCCFGDETVVYRMEIVLEYFPSSEEIN